MENIHFNEYESVTLNIERSIRQTLKYISHLLLWWISLVIINITTFFYPIIKNIHHLSGGGIFNPPTPLFKIIFVYLYFITSNIMPNKLNVSPQERLMIKSLHNIINEEQDRVVSIHNLDSTSAWDKYNSEGLIPYMLNTKVGGKYKLVEVRQKDVESLKYGPDVGRIFLISPEKIPQIQKSIDSVNNLINEYLNIIELYKKQLIGIIEKLT